MAITRCGTCSTTTIPLRAVKGKTAVKGKSEPWRFAGAFGFFGNVGLSFGQSDIEAWFASGEG